MEVDPPPAPAPEATPAALPGDSFYAVDETAVDAQRQAKPWTQDATYFKRVAVSPAASTKMLAHAQRGCEAGVKAGGKPLEVMGLLLGYPDADASKRRLVVTDALPLPVTGFETSVVADDDNVVNCVEIKILRRVHRVDLHAIDATPARWRGDTGSSPLDGASTAASSPRNDLVKNYQCTRHTG